jgi:uncharacterized membrane protein
MDSRTRRASIVRRIRTYFLTGLLVLGPVVVTGYIVWKLFIFVDHLLGTTLRGGYIRPGGVPGLGFATVLLIIFVTGVLANNILGRSLGGLLESLVLRVPFFKGVYSTVKEVGEALLSERRSFNRVVLVEFPSPGVWTIGFVTSTLPPSLQEATGRKLVGVFLPTPPNPTTGPLLFYPEEQVLPTSLTVEQAIKMCVSAGVVMPSDGPRAGA